MKNIEPGGSDGLYGHYYRDRHIMGADCLVEKGIQRDEAAQFSGLSASGARSHLPFNRSRVIPTLKVAQIMGAGEISQTQINRRAE